MRESDQTMHPKSSQPKEPDNAIRQSAKRPAQLTEATKNHLGQVQAAWQDILEEREQLRITGREKQEEIDQSAELLIRAAADALGDKGSISKLEGALGKVKEQHASDWQERFSAVLEKIREPEEEQAMYTIQPFNHDNEDALSRSLGALVTDVVICRRCCSGSKHEKHLFSITCGYSVHNLYSNGDSRIRASGKRVWQCVQCWINWDAKANIRSATVSNGISNRPTSPTGFY